MIVALDATSIGSGLGGDETLVAAMARGLMARLGPDARVCALAATDAVLPPELENDPRVRIDRRPRHGGVRHFGWDLDAWLRALRHDGVVPDVVVTNTHAPLWTRRPVALMVPDLSFLRVPDAYPRSTRWRLRSLLRLQVPRAAHIMTISQFCRDDIARTYGLPPERLTVVPLVIDPPAPADARARDELAARGVVGRYLLYLGNLHPRKNVPRLIRAYLRARERQCGLSDTSLVIAGRTWFGSTSERDAAAAAPEGAVVFLDRVDDAEREVLMRDAEALGYVSTFEGFGLPPLEAMARGTAVLASNVTSIPEICDDAALLVDPLDDAAIEDGIVRLLTDPQLRESLVEAGHRRATDFSVDHTGAAMMVAVDRAITRGR